MEEICLQSVLIPSDEFGKASKSPVSLASSTQIQALEFVSAVLWTSLPLKTENLCLANYSSIDNGSDQWKAFLKSIGKNHCHTREIRQVLIAQIYSWDWYLKAIFGVRLTPTEQNPFGDLFAAKCAVISCTAAFKDRGS